MDWHLWALIFLELRGKLPPRAYISSPVVRCHQLVQATRAAASLLEHTGVIIYKRQIQLRLHIDMTIPRLS